ncbi:unnamed protein product [Withania somnifera]
MEALGKSLLIFFVVTVMAQKNAIAAQHVVSGSQGWDESADFNSWASGQTFKVGDTLVFRYNPGLHSVVELEGESSYKSCDISSAVNSMSTGNDVVKLNKPGSRYFACGTAGMKLKITTVTGNSPTNETASSAPSSSSAASLQFSTPFFAFIAAILTIQMTLVYLL